MENQADTKAAKLSQATELALDKVIEILSMPVDANDLRLMAQIKDTALQIISQQIRVDEQRLRQREGEQLVEYTAAVERQEKLIGKKGK